MRSSAGGIKTLVALGAAVLVTGAVTPAVGAAIVSTGPVEAATPSTIAVAMPPSTAAATATATYDESAAGPGSTVRIVTVEKTTTGPRIVSHQVTSPTQAAAIATDAAHGNDLEAVELDATVRPIGSFTNDYFASSEWGVDPAKTTFSSAWRVTKGAGITVAVVDTGVAASHPDLAGKVLPGHEFLHPTVNSKVTVVDRDVNPMTDLCGHGTHVAGTIAAIPGNGIGIAGAAPGVKILPVRVLNAAAGCGGYSSDVANGIKWAANKGARVINLSVGGPGPDSALTAAVAYARSKGAVVVAAAGNNGPCKVGNTTTGNNAVSYPAATPGVIAVAAVDSNLTHACFSNTGSYVDLSAPGVHVISTYPPNLTGKGFVPYAYMDGTSMASPHVAAAAALVLAKRPACTPDRVENMLKATARRLGSGWPNATYGSGFVDPYRAVSGAC